MDKNKNKNKNMGMYKFETEAYFSGDGSEKPKLTHSDCSNEEDFSEKTDMSDIVDYLMKNDRFFAPHINNLRSGTVKTSVKNANAIWVSLQTEFGKRFEPVDIFSCITDFYGFDTKHYFDSLTQEWRLQLIKNLSERCDMDWHKRNMD